MHVCVLSILQGVASSANRVKWKEEDASPASPAASRASPSTHLYCCKLFSLSVSLLLSLCREPAQQKHLVDEFGHYISYPVYLHALSCLNYDSDMYTN